MTQAKSGSPTAIVGWLARGWRDYRHSWPISSAYSAIFVLIGGGLVGLLMRAELYPILYPSLAGFLLVAPVIVVGFYRVADILHAGGHARASDFLYGLRQAPLAIWGIALLLGFCFVIWITDVLLLYVLYFDIEALPLDRILDEILSGRMTGFLFFATLMGFVLALAVFAISAFSLPLVCVRHYALVPAVVSSVKTVFTYPVLMLGWAACLAVTTFFALFVFLPILVVVLPVLAFAGYHAFLELFPEPAD